MSLGHSPQAAHTHQEPAVSNARLAAELQAVALAIRIGGLDGLRSGAVKIGSLK